MLTSAVERKHAAHELQRHREFERQVAQLSTNFINIPADALDAGIRRALRELAGVTRDDWAVLYVAEAGSTTAMPAYEWCDDSVRAARGTLRPLALHDGAPFARELRERGTVQRVLSAAAHPSQPVDAQELSGLGMAAIVHVALISKGELLGTLAFA